MTSSPIRKGPIVVVGAGMAGLGAALTLGRAGRDVVLLERLDVVGGLARSVAFDDHVFDMGPHYFFLDVSEHVNELIRTSVRPEEWRPIDFKIGAKIGRSNVPWPPSASAVFKLPFSAIYGFLRSSIRRQVPDTYAAEGYMKGIFGEKMWRIFLGPYIHKKVPVGGGATKLHRDWWNQTARTIHNVPDVKRDKVLQLEPDLIERYLDRYPSVREEQKQNKARTGADGHNPTGLRRMALIARGLFRTAFAKNYKKVLYPPGGVGIICERLAEDFVRRGGELVLKASNVTFETSGHHVSRVSWDGGVVEEPDQVVWTGSIHRFCSLAGIDREDLPFMTILLALMKIRKPLPAGDDLYTYIADPDIVFNRIYYPNRSVEGLCPVGKDSLCVEVSRTEFRDEKDRARLKELIVDGLEKLRVCSREDIEDMSYVSIPDSYPVYPLDYREKLDRIWAEHDKFDNVRSIGRSGQFWYNNMARSMRAGVETAQDLLGSYEP